MGNNSSKMALILSIVAIVIILVIILVLAYEYDNRPAKTIIDTNLAITYGKTGSSESISPENNSIYINSPTSTFTLTINHVIPKATVSNIILEVNNKVIGSTFYISNSNISGGKDILIVPGVGVTFVAVTSSPLISITLNPTKTIMFIWRTDTEIMAMTAQ